VQVRNPDSIRPWQHVLNPLGGYLMLAQALWSSAELAGGWNFGPGEEDARPVRWIVQRMGELWPGQLLWMEDAEPHPSRLHEARYLKLDSSRARSHLGWRPRWGLREGLEATVAWYRAMRAGEDMSVVTAAQIEAYEQACAAA
jgi:CDP-glucose 4,6-dehydratase